MILLLVAFVASREVITRNPDLEGTQFGCVFTEDGVFFDYNDLYKKDGDYELSFESKNEKNRKTKYNLHFNFCKEITHQCKDVNAYAAVFEDKKEATCGSLTGAFLNTTKSTKFVPDVNDTDHGHLILDYNTTTECRPGVNYGWYVEQICSTSNETTYTIDPKSIEANPCKPHIYFTSPSGCSIFSANGLFRWIESYFWIVAIVMIIIGGFELSYGLKLFKPTLFIIGTISVVAVILFVFYAWFLPRATAQWVTWVMLAVSTGLGLVFGFFLQKMTRIGVCALGAWGGVALGLLINTTFLYKTNSNTVFYLLVVGLAVVFGLVGLWKYKWVLIGGTAFVGSYVFVRGWSLFIGGFPNEFTIITEINEGRKVNIPGAYYAWLVAIILLTVVGVWWQSKQKKKMDNDDDYDFYSKV